MYVCGSHIVDIILLNDSFNFLFVCLKLMRPPPEEWTALVVAQYVIGLLLLPLNYWAKVDAHRCIGDWAWYWYVLSPCPARSRVSVSAA